jgi:DNA-binding CsgD family transcriptional regulator
MLRAYDEIKHEDIPVLQMLRSSSRAGTQVFRFRCRSFFNESTGSGIRAYATKYGHENVVIAMKFKPPEQLAPHIGLYRSNHTDEFSARDSGLIKAIFPHILEALSLNRAINIYRAESVTRRYCSAIADRHGFFLHAEPFVERLLELEWPGCGGLRMPRILIETLLSGAVFRGHAIVASKSSMDGLLFVKLRPICAADRLSARELAVASEVVQGKRHKEIAKKLGISPATARNHIQAIHEKLRVRNAAELVTEMSTLNTK